MAKKTAKKKVAKKKVAKKKPQILQRIAKLKGDLGRAQRRATDQGRRLVRESFKEIFKEFKGLSRFAWPQYTPHWNDGDEIRFGTCFESLAIDEEIGGESECVYTLERKRDLLLNKEKEEARIVMELAGDKKGWEVDELKRDLKTINTRSLDEVAEKHRIKKTIIEILQGIPDIVYENMFGEGLVVVSRDGVEVEGYEHD
jgi:hypothetical protein